MNKANRFNLVRLLLIPIFLFVASAAAIEKPDIMQAKVFDPSIDVTEYWVSEKLDGVRARWDGKQLISKNGHLLHAPDWFIEDFPDVTLDGELWLARGQYQQTVSIVSRKAPHSGWEKIKLMVFDLPDNPKPFSERVAAMRQMAQRRHTPYLNFIKQFRVVSPDELKQKLDQVVAEGGEGLMLHHQDSLYQHGRSNRLLKLKPYDDAEAVVIGYRPGKGQFVGKMGSLKVRAENGKEFYIGTGFSQREREDPPPLGSLISFRHQGYTDKGIPRFAVFIRIRDEP
ncbi:DNA ligase [Methylotuvimicrobium buryatense]|uniref:DNA ligase n=1 Tax=Methylotuvimicrobium buryatense TaxID=95641 RepID=A0A4V1IKD0_METBY|nr:DNA ligase [Methylotuvimicrobium buryatense]QCW84475.1 DNA ligase [Methylotuvimicrobium buryatense]